MNPQPRTICITRTLLVIMFAFLSLSGLFGIVFLIDPSGELVEMPISHLDKLPIDTFILPGLFLLIVYGIGAAIIMIGLIRQRSWAPVAGLLLGLVLIGWVIGQIILWGEPAFLQYLYLTAGAAIIILSWITKNNMVETP